MIYHVWYRYSDQDQEVYRVEDGSVQDYVRHHYHYDLTQFYFNTTVFDVVVAVMNLN